MQRESGSCLRKTVLASCVIQCLRSRNRSISIVWYSVNKRALKAHPRLHYERCLQIIRRVTLLGFSEVYLLRSYLRGGPLLSFLYLCPTIFCLLYLLLGTDHCSSCARSHLSHPTRRHHEWLKWLVPKRMLIAFKYPQLPIPVL